jgi:transcriptional antiterminator RfaH
MLLTPAQIPFDQPVASWFCLRAKPKREHIAAASLRQISEVEAFCPRLRFRKHTTRGPVWFTEPMFPGYVFARFDYGASHRQIRQRPAISGFLEFGGRLALLPDSLVRELKTHVGSDEVVEVNQGLEPGQSVQVIEGPLQGVEALVSRLISSRDRVEILIEWMGRSLVAEVSAADLVPLNEKNASNLLPDTACH